MEFLIYFKNRVRDSSGILLLVAEVLEATRQKIKRIARPELVDIIVL